MRQPNVDSWAGSRACLLHRHRPPHRHRLRHRARSRMPRRTHGPTDAGPVTGAEAKAGTGRRAQKAVRLPVARDAVMVAVTAARAVDAVDADAVIALARASANARMPMACRWQLTQVRKPVCQAYPMTTIATSNVPSARHAMDAVDALIARIAATVVNTAPTPSARCRTRKPAGMTRMAMARPRRTASRRANHVKAPALNANVNVAHVAIVVSVENVPRRPQKLRRLRTS